MKRSRQGYGATILLVNTRGQCESSMGCFSGRKTIAWKPTSQNSIDVNTRRNTEMETANPTVKAVLNHLLQNGGGYFHYR